MMKLKAKSHICLATMVCLCIAAIHAFVYPLRDLDIGSDPLVEKAIQEPANSTLDGVLLMDGQRVLEPIKAFGFIKQLGQDREFLPYTQQYGWQGQWLNAVVDLLGIPARLQIPVARLLCCAIFAVGVTGLFVGLGRRFSWQVAWLFLLLCVGWTGAWRWAGSLYWCGGWTMLILAWASFAPIRRSTLYFGVLFVLFVVRFLAGYEFITCLSLGAVAAMAFNYTTAGKIILWRPLVGVWAISIAAFATAVFLHLYRLVGLGATWWEAGQSILLPARYRTIGMDGALEKKPLAAYVANLISPFFQNGTLSTMLPLLLILWLSRKSVSPSQWKPYLMVLGLSLGASMSWFVFGFSHAKYHPHLTNMLFAQSWMWMLFMVVAIWVTPQLPEMRFLKTKKS